jgi:hypothetical protein
LYLILGYTRGGLQIWDTTNFKSVTEVFNVNFDSSTLEKMGFGEVVEVEVVDASIVPSPPTRRGRKVKKAQEEQESAGPVLGILFRSTSHEGRPRFIFVMYSLKTHVVLAKVDLEGYAERFEANERVVVVVRPHVPCVYRSLH